MRNFWLNAFITPEDYDGCTWNAQVLDTMFDEVSLIDSYLESGETEDELVLHFLFNEQSEPFDIDELVDHLEDSVEAIFDVCSDGDVIEMHTLFIWDSKVTTKSVKNDVQVTWRFKHRCLFSGVW